MSGGQGKVQILPLNLIFHLYNYSIYRKIVVFVCDVWTQIERVDSIKTVYIIQNLLRPVSHAHPYLDDASCIPTPMLLPIKAIDRQKRIQVQLGIGLC